MAWVKLDDQFADHPKVVRAGEAAAWLFVAGLCYCSKHLTDGFIPAEAVPKLSSKARTLAERLVEVGLWERAEGGYQVHDYLDWQPPAQRVKERRDATRERVREWRGERKRNGVTDQQGNGVTNTGGNGVTEGVGNGVTNASVTASHAQPHAGGPSPSPPEEKKFSACAGTCVFSGPPNEATDAEWLRLTGVWPGDRLPEVADRCARVAAALGWDPVEYRLHAVAAFNALCDGGNLGFKPQKAPHNFLRRFEDVQQVIAGTKSPDQAGEQRATAERNGGTRRQHTDRDSDSDRELADYRRRVAAEDSL